MTRRSARARDAACEVLDLHLREVIDAAIADGLDTSDVVGIFVAHAIFQTRRAGRTWETLVTLVREGWQATRRQPAPEPGTCSCLRLTLVDVPRAAMNAANPHHPSCEHYAPPAKAGA